MSYTHFTLEERKYLQQLLSEKKSFREIAKILGRSPSTISREVRRNSAKWKPHRESDNPYWYNHWRAQNLYIRRRREHTRMGLVPNSEEWNYVVSGLEKYWSPETICGRWHKEHPDRKPLCISTIYRYIRQNRFQKITAKTHLFARGNPTITASSLTASSPSGRKKYASEQESAIGRVIRCTAGLGRDCL